MRSINIHFVSIYETIIIGGLIQSETTKTVAKIPLLGDIPVLGQLFTSKKFQEDQTELLVFLTPVILKGGEDVSGIMLDTATPEEREAILREGE